MNIIYRHCTDHISYAPNMYAVGVAPPWEMNTFVPQGSSIHINCTANSGQSPLWSIRLTDSSDNFLHFPFPASQDLLNNHGFYEIPQDDSEIIRLIVNSTQDNNGTLIRCIDGGSLESPTIYETTLIVYGRYYADDYTVYT